MVALSCAAWIAARASPIAAEVLVNATTPLALTAYSTLNSAGFEWRIDGDDNGNCAVTLEYRRAGEGAWKPAQPLLRVEHGLWTHGEDPGNLLAGSLFSLTPATAYEARLTLSDPDGGSDQRVVAFSTRGAPEATSLRTLYVIPGSGGGSGTQADPFRGLAAADAAARPGDLFLVQPGTFHGKFSATRDGAPDNPIVYRGASSTTVVLDGDGGTTSSSHCVSLVGRRYVFLENLSLVNCLRPVNADSSTGVVIRGCTIQPINQLLYIEGIRAAYSRDLFIANNVVQMSGQWATIGRTGTYGTGGYGILIEGTGHVVCHNTVIEAWDGISIPVTGTAVPATTTSNVDIYENFVDRASDDGVQADAVQQNVRVFRNRLLNTGSAVSFQPAFGGPGYVLFNEIYNTRIEPYKFHQETSYGWTQETSGFLVFHNTSVSNRNGWYESGIWHHGTFRNNLLLGARPNTPTFQANYTYPGASFDFDGYDRVNDYTTLIRFSGTSYANLPAFYAGTGNEPHGIEMSISDFVSATLPHHPEWDYTNGYGAPYGPNDNDLRLAPGSAPVDRGVPLANIDEGFGGAAPDLGCYETGQPVPAYGPRPADQPLTASAGTDCWVGNAPLTIRFSGGAANARGVVVGYHWDFGDGGHSADRSPTYTYASAGSYTALLSVTDDDGSVARASVSVHALGPSSAVSGGPPASGLRSMPNPSRGASTVQFSLTEPSCVRLEVYDVNGVRVRTLLDGFSAAGPQQVEWDGRGADGRPLSPGIYFLRLSVRDGALVLRTVLLR